ncbi:LysR family transcriptional regulator [Pokkaliibacter sp. CJK22405]|uniref:LysR family transcriptional regulator n=1 Tax=Pokkaliibacter sp. CJK22405 TaxID=3384615 RepID=UPI00398475E9
MDRLDAMQLFTRIVETGSFTQAANSLNIPRATATHAIKQLEERLSVRLLERTTRKVRTTPDGQAYYQRCMQILDDLEEAESALQNSAANPQGILRVDMHNSHAIHVVLPRIQEFRERYPRIELVLSSGDRLVDLLGEGIDCVIRGGVPKDSSLIARKLAVVPEVLCASPAYIERFGKPSHPDELLQHQVVRFFNTPHEHNYPLEFIVDGQERSYDVPGWISVNSSDNYVASALSGCGIIQLPRFPIEPLIQSGQLVELLPQWQSPGVQIHAMYPYHRQLSVRVRVFVDWVTSLYQEKFGPLR